MVYLKIPGTIQVFSEKNMNSNRTFFSGLVVLLFLAATATTAAAAAPTGKPRTKKPLVAPGPTPDAAILFLGNLHGKISPCL